MAKGKDFVTFADLREWELIQQLREAGGLTLSNPSTYLRIPSLPHPCILSLSLSLAHHGRPVDSRSHTPSFIQPHSYTFTRAPTRKLTGEMSDDDLREVIKAAGVEDEKNIDVLGFEAILDVLSAGLNEDDYEDEEDEGSKA